MDGLTQPGPSRPTSSASGPAPWAAGPRPGAWVRAYLVRSVGIGLPGTLGASLLAVSTIPFLLRRVGLEQYGTWTLVFMFTGISSTLDIGLPRALVFLLPKVRERREADELFTACLAVLAGLVLAVALLAFGAVHCGVPVWGSARKIPPATARLLAATGVNLVACSLLASLAFSALEAASRIYLVSVCNFCQTALTYLSALLVSCRWRQAAALILATNAAYLAMTLASLALVRRATPLRLGRLSPRAVRRVLETGLDFFLIGIVNSLAMPLMRYLVIRFSPDMAAVGLYDIALKVSQTGNTFLNAFSLPLFSLFSGFGPGRINLIRKVARGTARVTAALLAAALAATWLLSAPLFSWVLHVDGARLRATVAILLAGWGATAICQPYIRALWALGKATPCLLVNLGMLGVNLLLVAVLAPVADPLQRVALAIAGSLVFDGAGHYLLFRGLFPRGGGVRHGA